MTDQQYTPTKAEIMDSYRRGRVWTTPNGGRTYAAEFERWYKKVIAAAEQRGAVRAYDEGRADCIYDFDLCKVTGEGYGCGECADCIGNNPYLADRIGAQDG